MFSVFSKNSKNCFEFCALFQDLRFLGIVAPHLIFGVPPLLYFCDFLSGPHISSNTDAGVLHQQLISTVSLSVGPTGHHSGPHSLPLGSLDSQAGHLSSSNKLLTLSCLVCPWTSFKLCPISVYSWIWKCLFLAYLAYSEALACWFGIIPVQVTCLNQNPPLWTPQRLISIKSQRKSTDLAFSVHFA